MSQQAVKNDGKSEKFRSSVWFILSNIFLERFSSGGVLGKIYSENYKKVLKFIFGTAILALYFNHKLHFDTNTSTTVFHANELILYFSSIIGAVMADTWLGLLKTISLMSFLMSVGSAIIAVTSIDQLHLPMK